MHAKNHVQERQKIIDEDSEDMGLHEDKQQFYSAKHQKQASKDKLTRNRQLNDQRTQSRYFRD